MRAVTAALAALLFAASPATAFRDGGSAYYRSSDGQMIHRPTRGNTDYGRVTAVCRDGSRSFSHHRRGTCTGHGGVQDWR